MKAVITSLYFATMLFIVAFLTSDFGYTFSEALFISATYLPTIILTHALLRGFKFERKISVIAGVISFIIAIYVLQLLLIALANFSLSRLSYQITMPDVVINPVLVSLILMLYYLPYRFIVARLFKPEKRDKVEFISNRKRVTLLIKDITYVESRDSEVWLHTVDGHSLRSRSYISSWERELECDFLRIHRSYLVNKVHIEQVTKSSVVIKGGITLEISRSYKQQIECAI